MKKNEEKLLNIIKTLPYFIISLLSLLIITLIFHEEEKELRIEKQFIEKQFIELEKERIKTDIDTEFDYIKEERKKAQEEIKKELKRKMTIAYNVSKNIYEKNKDKLSKIEITKRIKTVLETFRFDDGNGYFLIYSNNGINIFNPVDKESEGKNHLNKKDIKGDFYIQKAISLGKSKKDTFMFWYDFKPSDNSKEYKKFGIVKNFEPYDFTIITAIYEEDHKNSLHKEIINHLSHIRYKDNGYIFIHKYNSEVILHKSKKTQDYSYLEDRLKKIISDEKKSSFIIESSKGELNKEVLYLKKLDDWQWIIGTSFKLNKVNEIIKKKELIIEEKHKSYKKKILFFGIILTALMFLISYLLVKFLEKRFLKYEQDLIKKDEEKNKELKFSAQLYKDLFESNKSIILILDSDNGNIFDANLSACDFYGYKREKLISMNISDINTASKEEIELEIGRAKSLQKNYFSFIHRLSNGELRNVRVVSSFVKYANKNALFSVISDSTKEYKIQHELLKSEQQFKTLFEFSNIGLGIRDKEGKFIQVNKKFLSMLGYEESFILNKSCTHISISDERKEAELFGKLLNKELSNYNIEKKFIKKNGTEIDVILTMASILDQDNNIINVLSSIIDISEIKEKDRLLIQQSKMAIMGEMIGNIAHQWKQPLSMISMSNGLLKLNQEDSSFSTKEELDEAIDNIENSVEHLSTTIDDFRNFFKPEKEKKHFSIKTIFDKTLRLVNSQLRNNEIKVFDNSEDIDMFGYPNELLQVLINIIKNAKDELLKNNEKDEKLIFIKSYIENDKIIIEVKDNAGGVPLEIIDDIFKPYFTTKKEEGTGVGLYMSKQIIEGMSGKIEVSNVDYEYEDAKYSGAEFRIEFDNNEKAI